MLPTPFVKSEPDIAYKEQFSDTAFLPPEQPNTENPTSDNFKNQNGKRPLKKMPFLKKKKQKLAKCPVYTDGCQPAMILNEYYKNLQFTYENDLSNPTRPKFICFVTIDVKDQATRKFQGVGTSKKIAKKECCNQALNSLFPDSYHGPEVLHPEEVTAGEIFTPKICILKRLTELRRRISKLVTPQTIQIKSPSQILHELSAKISDSGIFVEDNINAVNKKFFFQIKNIPNESLVNLDQNLPHTLIACGYGKSKKEAKNEASSNALKQFFNCDLNKMIEEANMVMINQLKNQQIKFVLPNSNTN